MPKSKSEVNVVIPEPMIDSMKVGLKGDTPLIFHKWSEKAKRMILDKQQKKPSAGREVRDPQAEYQSSFYRDADGYVCFPALAVKNALVNGTRGIGNLNMTTVRALIWVVGDKDGLIRVLTNGKPTKVIPEIKMLDDSERHGDVIGVDPNNPEIVMREDMVRIGMGTADLRYRGQVTNWQMKFIVKYNASMISAAQVLNLFQYAGFGAGLGEWRPEKNGDKGMFSLEHSKNAVVPK